MGILDRLRGLVGAGETAAPVPRGPLGLVVGDSVAYYKEQWTVAGMRRFGADAGGLWHYCLRGKPGDVVLAADESDEGALWLERTANAELAWDQDVLTGVGDEPLRLTHQGRVNVEHFGDTPQPRSRTVQVRRFRDESGDRSAVLEDWYGRRDARIGEFVHEGELTIVRGGEDAPAGAGPHHDAAGDDAHPRGSPIAAARALALGADNAAAPHADDAAPPEKDASFDDEDWNDDTTGEGSIPAPRPAAVVIPQLDCEEEEWRDAARHLREHGIPVERRR